MSKNTTTLRNNEIAKKVSKIVLAQKDFCKLYNISTANMNVDVESHTNRVVLVAENVELSQSIVKTMKLQDDFMSAVSRITVWLDSNAVVVFVGAVFAVHAKLAQQTKEQTATFEKLFKESRDEKYNTRKLKKVTITAQTETRHTFESVEQFETFFSLLAQLVTARKTALLQTDSKAQTDSKKDSKKEQSAQKDSKKNSNKKNSKKDMSKVSTEQLAQLTKEIVESETTAK